MKKIVIILLFLSMLVAFQKKEDKKVYICSSVASTSYHFKKKCRGLSNCKTAIKESTEKRVKKFGRLLCKWEEKELKKK
ncbi:hypothetical protein P8625_05900 [Tenacibaculum tangerinum]|uniref:Uncharacterized protein n=1 Tax=Tenacibaculum tangerinum TaxID=3038772 RepID=A0ABY8L5M0_9FLAO|nr:hypothetical protein [Tenacibaculum tangerinum]WGH76690.1 hypothetical protein P8625_05900 [Tenacibaculum tangerinum]